MTTFSNQSLMRNKYYNWIIKNFFSSWVNSLMTVVAIIFIYEVGTFFLNWAFFAADFRTNFQGELITDRSFCSKNIMPGEDGACWSIIYARRARCLYGVSHIEDVGRVTFVYRLITLEII